MFGISKELNLSQIRCSFTNQNGIDIIKVNVHSSEILIIPLYIRGADWDTDFDVVKRYFNEENPTNTVVIGDLNVRIGELQQEIDQCCIHSYYTYSGIRKSKDSEVNSKGKKMMEFCGDYGLIVLNGATKGDEDGNFTFISGVGESVNDICAVSQEIIGVVDYFNVDNKIWSDHMPLCLDLKIKTRNDQTKR